MVVDPQDMAMAMSSTGKPKNSFIPSKWEAEKVRKMVKAIREVYFSLLAVWLCAVHLKLSRRYPGSHCTPEYGTAHIALLLLLCALTHLS